MQLTHGGQLCHAVTLRAPPCHPQKQKKQSAAPLHARVSLPGKAVGLHRMAPAQHPAGDRSLQLLHHPHRHRGQHSCPKGCHQLRYFFKGTEQTDP